MLKPEMSALTALGWVDELKLDGVPGTEVQPTKVGDLLKQNDTVVWLAAGLTSAFKVPAVPV